MSEAWIESKSRGDGSVDVILRRTVQIDGRIVPTLKPDILLFHVSPEGHVTVFANTVSHLNGENDTLRGQAEHGVFP